MTLTRDRRTIIAATIGGAVVLAVLALLFATHDRALFAPRSQTNAAESFGEVGTLNIPTIDEMCAALGAAGDILTQCKADEEAAGEFVIAWMGLHGFIANGTIDLAQIQLAATLGPNPFEPLSDTDNSLSDPSLLTGDPGIDGTGASLNPLTGDAFESYAQIALFCMSSSTDWVQMQACISEHDSSTGLTGQ